MREFAECHGDIIAFLDGDDWWAPGKLRRVVDEMERNPEVGIVGHGITEVFDNGDEHSEVLHEACDFGSIPWREREFSGVARVSSARAG